MLIGYIPTLMIWLAHLRVLLSQVRGHLTMLWFCRKSFIICINMKWRKAGELAFKLDLKKISESWLYFPSTCPSCFWVSSNHYPSYNALCVNLHHFFTLEWIKASKFLTHYLCTNLYRAITFVHIYIWHMSFAWISLH